MARVYNGWSKNGNYSNEVEFYNQKTEKEVDKVSTVSTVITSAAIGAPDAIGNR